jgi:hypothetical protein
MFYSDGMRKLWKPYISSWIKHPTKKIFVDMMTKHQKLQDIEYYNFFTEFTPEYILRALHKEQPSKFIDVPFVKVFGFESFLYVARFFYYLGFTDFHVSFHSPDGVLHTDPKTIKENGKHHLKKMGFDFRKMQSTTAPKLLIVLYNLFDSKQEVALKNTIEYLGHTYKIDATTLTNWDIKSCGHEIAGITCSKNKYIYNGWVMNSRDPTQKNGIFQKVPCALYPMDWATDTRHFCIDPMKCEYNNPVKNNVDMCFSFKLGQRVAFYVL